MNKTGFAITAILVGAVIMTTACVGQKPVTAVARNITGEITGLSVPLNGNETNLIVQTAQGPQTVQLAANTTYTVDGQACAIDDLGKLLESGNTTYNCTVIIDPCAPGVVAQYMALYTVAK